MLLLSVPFVLLVLLLFAAYLYIKISLTYWKRKKVPHIEPTFPFGNFKNTFLQRTTLGDEVKNIYESTTEPVIGIYSSFKPMLLIRDPKIIQDILVKDFTTFHHRGLNVDANIDQLSSNLVCQNGEKWKYMRSKLSATLTIGKIRAMFDSVYDCGSTLEKCFSEYADCDKTIEIQDVFSRFAIDVILSIGFGIDSASLKNLNDKFLIYGRKLFDPTLVNVFRINMHFMLPKLANLFRIRLTDKNAENFMIDVVRQNLEYRETSNFVRKDFFQMLIQLKNTGKIQNDNDDWKTEKKLDTLTIPEITAQSYLFFVAGYETSATTMSYCMYEFARNPDVQQKAYEEIIEVIAKCNGDTGYDFVKDLKYLDNCMDGKDYILSSTINLTSNEF